MNIRGAFTDRPKPAHWAFRYGLLVGSLLLLAWHIHWRLNLPADYPYARDGNGVIGLMLIINVLAYQFRWSTPVTVALRVFGLGLACLYLFLPLLVGRSFSVVGHTGIPPTAV